jgi:hypothetical protein
MFTNRTFQFVAAALIGVAVIASTSSPEPMLQFAISPAQALKVTPTLRSA